MKERRILPSSLKKYEKYIKEPTFLLTEPVHIEEDILDNSVKTQQAQVLTMESVRIDFPLKPCKNSPNKSPRFVELTFL